MRHRINTSPNRCVEDKRSTPSSKNVLELPLVDPDCDTSKTSRKQCSIEIKIARFNPRERFLIIVVFACTVYLSFYIIVKGQHKLVTEKGYQGIETQQPSSIHVDIEAIKTDKGYEDEGAAIATQQEVSARKGDNDNEDTANTKQQQLVSRSASAIPRRFIFTYRNNMLKTKEPRYLFHNVVNTIQKYRQAWGSSAAATNTGNGNSSNNDVLPEYTNASDVLFLDDGACLRLLHEVEPRLVTPFRTDPYGAHKADMCRVAALYKYGGYYFDVDLEVLHESPVVLPHYGIEFVTSWTVDHVSIFQAVLFAAANHTILRASLDSMIHDWYYNRKVMTVHGNTWFHNGQLLPPPSPSQLLEGNSSKFLSFNPEVFYSEKYQTYLKEKSVKVLLNSTSNNLLFMGTSTMALALKRNKALQQDTSSVLILEEIRNVKDYPKHVRQDSSWGCNFMVHDPKTRTPYFYSRCVGSPGCPTQKKPLVVPTKAASTPSTIFRSLW